MINIRIYGKKDCSLCGPFEQVFNQLLADEKWQRHIQLKKIDIETDPDAMQKYHDKIPVAEINGKLAFKYRVNIFDLKKRLLQEITHQ